MADDQGAAEDRAEEAREPYGLLDRLAKFDARAGHNFAWYFYMLHGNRVVSSVGEFMAEAVENGLCRLPAWDREILRRWKEQPYGF